MQNKPQAVPPPTSSDAPTGHWLEKYIAQERAYHHSLGISDADWNFWCELIGDHTEDEIAAMDSATLARIYEQANRKENQ